MVDMAMCQRKDCPLRHKCYRFMAIPDPYWQSYLVVEKIGKDCEHFIYFKQKRKRRHKEVKK